MSILSKHLQKFLKKCVIVVMDDDMAYFGQLREFDENFLILDHTREAEYKKNPIWKDPRIKITSAPLPIGPEETRIPIADFVDERLVGKSLATVLINIAHVVRVWGEDFCEEGE